MNQNLLFQLALNFLNNYEPLFNNVKDSFYNGKETDFENIKFEDLDYETIFKKREFRQIDKVYFISIIYRSFNEMVDLFECGGATKELKSLEMKDVSNYSIKELNALNFEKESCREELKTYNNSYFIKQGKRKNKSKLYKRLDEFYEHIMIVENVLRGELMFLSGKEQSFDNLLKDLDFDLGTEFIADENEKTSTKYNLSLNTKTGSIRDLKELVYVICKSELIHKDKNPISNKDLAIIFNELLGTKINANSPTDDMNKRTKEDTFIKKLHGFMNDYIDSTSK